MAPDRISSLNRSYCTTARLLTAVNGGKCRRQLVEALRHPQQRTHRIAQRRRFDEVLEIIEQRRVTFTLSSRTATFRANAAPSQRRALTLLAGSRHGVIEELLVRGHGFSRAVLASLTRRRLAAKEREVMMAGAKPVEVVRVRITAAGRRAIGSDG